MKTLLIGSIASGAALLCGASAHASLLGDAVTISRVQGGNTIVKTVNASVGAGTEYSDNFFNIDVTGNEIIFGAAGGNFSIGDIVYTFDGLDFDDKPETPNIVESFTATQVFGPGAIPITQGRVTIAPSGRLTMSFMNTTGGSNGLVRVTLGAPTPTAVPEPSAWAMMIAGFTLLGATARRRTRTALANA